jgi:hypothetical protein
MKTVTAPLRESVVAAPPHHPCAGRAKQANRPISLQIASKRTES